MLFLENDEIITSGLNKIQVELQDQTNQFYLQTLFRKDFALSLGAEHKRLKIKSETIVSAIDDDDDFIFENTDYFSVFSDLKLDTYNHKYFPTQGVYFHGDFHYYMLASKFNSDFKPFAIAKADLGYAFKTSNKLAFNLNASTGFKLGDNGTSTLDFALGGYGNNLINNFIPFIGYDFLSLVGNSYVKASAVADYQLIKKHHLTLEIDWANIGVDVYESGEWFTLPDFRGYGLGYGVETFIGPTQIKYSYSPEQRKGIWFFNVGFWF